MEFPFDLNGIFPERITILDQNLTTSRKCLGRPDLQRQIATVIDELGKASAKAQQLAAPITSAMKLQSTRHHLYLLKDAESYGGRGMAVGYLKVGLKKLFLLDQHGSHVETEPLCVLDFFVTESLQRHGYGLELFCYMLQHKRLDPVQMAYDRPSPKFLSFLEKHYGLKDAVPQVNNFVVFSGFFRNRSAVQTRKIPARKPEGDIKPYSLTEREAVREEQKGLPWPFAHHHPHPPLSPPLPQSSPYSRSLSVGSSPSRVPAHPSLGHGLSRGQEPSPHSQYIENLNCRARRTRHRDPVALGNVYSHRANSGHKPGEFKLPGLQPVQGESEADTQSDAALLGHTDTHRALPTLPPLTLPPLHGSRKHSSSTPLARHERDKSAKQLDEEEGQARRGQQTKGQGRTEDERKATDQGQEAWSWTVGEGPWTAQWVRRKQEYRSTRPW